MKKETYHMMYLHGFASGPDSRKARFFKQRLMVQDITMVIPDLNQPDFSNLSFNAMVQSVHEIIREKKNSTWIIMASSLGALVALQAASQEPQVEKLILLAPAFGFFDRRESIVGKNNLEKWENSGTMKVYHHGYKKEMPISYQFIRELEAIDEYDFSRELPIKIFHGAFDDVVSFEYVEKFATSRDYVQYHLLESDHSLMNKLDWIWKDMLKFIPIEKRNSQE